MSEKLARKLAERLDDTSGTWDPHRLDDFEAAEIEQLSKLVGRIRQAPHPVVSDAFRRNARIRILNQVAAAGSGKAPTPEPVDPKLRLTTTLRNVLFAMAILVGFLFTGELVSFSAKSALPGDLLYPVKLGLENAQDLFAADAEDAILQTHFASNRLTEIQLLVAEERYAEVDTAVAAYERNIDGAVTALAAVARADGGATYPLLVQVEDDLQQYAHTLADLLTFVPVQTQDALARAITASQSLSLPVD